MKAKLTSLEHGDFVFGKQASLGRTEGNSIPLEHKTISSTHAKIVFDPQRLAYILEDLDSLNGTELDGTPIEHSEYLDRLHVIRFGGSQEFIFQTLDVTPQTESDISDPEPDRATLVDESGDQGGAELGPKDS